MQQYLNNQRAWVLIDAMIAVVIVSIALTALAMAFRQSTDVSTTSTNYVQAVYIAQQQLEQLKQYDGAAAANNPFNATNLAERTVQSPGGVPYNVSFGLLNSGATNLVSVQVTVKWTDAGRSNQVQLGSYYYLQ